MPLVHSSEVPNLTLWSFFFFNDTATTEIYTLSLHDALPISPRRRCRRPRRRAGAGPGGSAGSPCRSSRPAGSASPARSEEHTSELQSQSNLVCRLLLEKKNLKDKLVVGLDIGALIPGAQFRG